jgi:hypothetical protein
MGGTEMKWVWNEDKTGAVNLDHVESIVMEQDEKFILVKTWGENGSYTLGAFNTLQAAQEFISNLTGAVNGGNHV